MPSRRARGLTLAALLAIALACRAGSDGPTRLRSFGPVRVGAPIPSFGGVSSTGKPIGPTTPPGRFYLHVISDRLPPTCLDEECGAAASPVVAKGGHIIGGSDGKYADALGVELVSTRPWRLEPSLVVVTDAGGWITAIWKGAGLDEIPAILSEEGL